MAKYKTMMQKDRLINDGSYYTKMKEDKMNIVNSTDIFEYILDGKKY